MVFGEAPEETLAWPVVVEPDFVRSTRSSYDTLAADYVEYARGDLAAKPWDRAVLAVFAELLTTGPPGPVADVGCGTGRLTAHLHGLGVDVFGVDLSPGMLAVARQEHPGLRFEVGSMLALELADGSVAGLLAYYSTIHIPDDRLADVFAQFARVLVPGGHLLVAFQAGDGVLHMTEGLGHRFELDFHRRRPDHIAELLADVGLPMRAQVVREPEEGERTAQAYLVARKPEIDTGQRRATASPQ
jgi:SAM-dependent methyltransferase